MRMPGNIAEGAVRLFAIVVANPGHCCLQFPLYFVSVAGSKNNGAIVLLARLSLFAHQSVRIGYTNFRTKIRIDANAGTELLESSIEPACHSQNLAIRIVG